MKSYLLKVAAALPPGFCDNCKSIPWDLTILAQGMVFTDELDIKLDQPTTTLFGLTVSIIIMKEDMIVLNGETLKDSI